MDNLIKVHTWKSITNKDKETIFRRSLADIDKLYKDVIPIIEKVKKKGDDAIIEFNKKFGDVDLPVKKLKVSPAEIEKAEKSLPKDVKDAIRIAYKNVLNYHKLFEIKQTSAFHEISKGIFISEKTTPIDSVGIYIPRGKGSFPSMVYMLATPALIAKVPRRVMVSPPLPDGTIDPACLYAAKLCNIHEIYKVGGAHAIAALAYGTKTIKQVNKIIGPGSAFVTAAKRYVSSFIDIGPPAGPSESLILADGTTSAELVAYDLCIEAEHGNDSMAIVLTHKKEFANSVATHLNKIIETAPSPQKNILKKVFAKYEGIILTDSEEQSIEISNQIAPEHLMIHSESPSMILSQITNAGEILLGKNTPFSIANYAAGANAVIPTGGFAKSFSAVSVSDFTKRYSVVQVTKTGAADIIPYVRKLADYEGFYFHEKALAIRDTSTKDES